MSDTTRLRELTIRYLPKSDDAGLAALVTRVLHTPRDCATALTALLQDEPCEVFVILCLTTKHRVIAYHEVSRGTLDTSVVHPREVFKAAFLANAGAIVLCHNHPSGDPAPSAEDYAVTSRLRTAGEILGIEVLDHLIIGDGCYVSFAESGRW